ncbi:DUF4129 domain-containing transglutaminase family protein [Paenibacillus sp. GCM10012303]|uniref:DUF4129 domain-containing transglutaminase family protein n=1 Tax=Paenibacillus sp. GCM10012303 TaxID=3317340 RepID=UPI003612D39B
MSSPERSYIREGVASALLFALLLEWLRPLLDMSEWSGVYRISPFLLAFGLFLAVDWLRLSPWIGWPLRMIVCVGIVGFLFDSPGFPGVGWLIHHAGLTMQDAAALADGEFAYFSPENRTMLFLIGWSMMISVIYASVVERQHALWFVAATLLYLLGLQLWPGVNTANAVIRTVWFGFLLMGLLQFSRLVSRFELRHRPSGWPARWLAVVPLLLAAVVAVGLWLPPEASTGVMKPLDSSGLADRLASWANGGTGAAASVAAGTSGPARTGYGEDDSVLGGPVRPDDSVAFYARTEKLTYWRGEAKTLYTGQGWEKGAAASEAAALSAADSGWRAAPIVQEVTLVDAALAGRLFAGGTIVEIERLVARSGRNLAPLDVIERGGAYTSAWSASDPLLSYRVKVAVPPKGGGTSDTVAVRASVPDNSWTVTMAPSEAWTVTAAVHQPAELAPIPVLPEPAAAEAAEAADGEADAAAESARRSESLRDRETFRAELQLPPGLPDRVYALADALTAGLTGDAERAQAIESFLQENYTYRMDVPKLPKTAADFADTFLFETKEGYCDYFSTSMAVLIRAVGIPARWVKGFTSGQVTGTGAGGMLDVTVLNRNAHSWVEAYIPGSGWTVFDPTPAGPDSALAESAAAVQASALPSAAGAADGDAPLMQRLQQRMAEAGQWLSGFGRQGAGGSDTLSAGMKWTAAALIALLLPLLIMLVRIVRRSPSIRNGPGYPSAGAYTSRRASSFRPFDKLWIRLFGRLGRKKPEHTVREYVESLPLSEVGQREALLDFVKRYEAVRYGAAPVPRTTARGLKELWRRITRGKE